MCIGHVSVQALYAYIHALFAICMSGLDGRDVAITIRGLTWQQNVAGWQLEQASGAFLWLTKGQVSHCSQLVAD